MPINLNRKKLEEQGGIPTEVMSVLVSILDRLDALETQTQVLYRRSRDGAVDIHQLRAEIDIIKEELHPSEEDPIQSNGDET